MAEGGAGDSISNILPNINTTDVYNMLGNNILEMDTFPDMFSMSSSDNNAYLEILEQPRQRGFRFRYSCEGPSHGGLPGDNSTKGRKSYPSVQINNHYGKARIEVTLVTASDPPAPHAHSLVGKNVKDGVCVVEVGLESGMTATFPNLGIQHVTKKNVKNVLKERYMKRFRLEKAITFSSGTDIDSKSGSMSDDAIMAAISREEMQKIDQKVEQETKTMNLSTVRLCFQTYLPDEQGNFVRCLAPVYSNPIFDAKAAAASELKICRIDKQSGSVQGGDEIFLLCDKVQKEDIEVRFYENEDDNSKRSDAWEDFGKFSTSDVHRQFAIVFKTPEYWNAAIEKPVQVLLELRRKSDRERSAPVEFTYKPQEFDPERIGAKRRKKVPHFGDFEQTTSKTNKGSDPGAGPSSVDPMSASAQFFNPLLFPYLNTAAAGMPFPGLFPGFPAGATFPAGNLPGVGATDGNQALFQSGEQEPSSSNMS